MPCRVGVPTSGTRPITAKDFADGTPTPGAVATCLGPDVPPAWGPGASLLPTVNQIVNVQKGGSDTTGNGTTSRPYLTVAHALATILDATDLKIYGILIGPGVYNDPLVLKPSVFVIGIAENVVQIGDGFGGGPVTMGPGFAAAGVHYCGAQNITFFDTVTLATLPAADVAADNRFTFVDCTSANAAVQLTRNATDAGASQAIFDSYDFVSGFGQLGWGYAEMRGCTFTSGMNVQGLAGFVTSTHITGGVISPTALTIDLNGGVGTNVFFEGVDASRCTLNLIGASPALNVYGAPGCLPINPSLVGGAVAPPNTVLVNDFSIAVGQVLPGTVPPNVYHLATDMTILGMDNVAGSRWAVQTTINDPNSQLTNCVATQRWAGPVGELSIYNPTGADVTIAVDPIVIHIVATKL